MNNKHNLEINDLIYNAVNNALERRNEALESFRTYATGTGDR